MALWAVKPTSSCIKLQYFRAWATIYNVIHRNKQPRQAAQPELQHRPSEASVRPQDGSSAPQCCPCSPQPACPPTSPLSCHIPLPLRLPGVGHTLISRTQSHCMLLNTSWLREDPSPRAPPENPLPALPSPTVLCTTCRPSRQLQTHCAAPSTQRAPRTALGPASRAGLHQTGKPGAFTIPEN